MDVDYWMKNPNLNIATEYSWDHDNVPSCCTMPKNTKIYLY